MVMMMVVLLSARQRDKQTESSTGPHCVPRVHTGPLASLPAYYLGAGLEVLVGEHSLYC